MYSSFNGHKKLNLSKAQIKERNSANMSVFLAVKSGEIQKPDKCEKCQAVGKVVGHHDDYRFPLKIRWLCWDCHAHWHAFHEPIRGVM